MRIEKHVPAEEILEEIWTLAEHGGLVTEAALLAATKMDAAGETLAAIERAGKIERRGGVLALLPAGESEAREIVRRNRLTSVLMRQFFEIEPEEAEEAACELEHVLSPRVTESICTLLGHPPHTADGRRIPRGACCESAAREAKPVVVPLASLAVGGSGRVAFIAPSAQASLRRLAGLGLTPGKTVRLVQKSPACVVEAGETTLAFDAAVAREIYVREA